MFSSCNPTIPRVWPASSLPTKVTRVQRPNLVFQTANQTNEKRTALSGLCCRVFPGLPVSVSCSTWRCVAGCFRGCLCLSAAPRGAVLRGVSGAACVCQLLHVALCCGVFLGLPVSVSCSMWHCVAFLSCLAIWPRFGQQGDSASDCRPDQAWHQTVVWTSVYVLFVHFVALGW